MKYPERHKCERCGTADYWIWTGDEGYWICGWDGNELYPPSMTVARGGRRTFSQAGHPGDVTEHDRWTDLHPMVRTVTTEPLTTPADIYKEWT